MERSIKRNLELTSDKTKYDSNAKNLLSEKDILANILQTVVHEFHNYKIEDIIPCIENVHIGNVSIAPGETDLKRIHGLSQENTFPNEGKIYFDILFRADCSNEKEYARVYINVEAQNKLYPLNRIPKRGVFYCARELSSQMEAEFVPPYYEHIKKVYSIWLCFNAPEKRANQIVSFHLQERSEKPMFEKTDYDILEVVLIGLNEDCDYIGTSKPQNRLCHLLNTVFSTKLSVDKKSKIMQNDYKINMTDTKIKEMNNMCNLSDGIFEKGTEQGIEQGIKRQKKEIAFDMLKDHLPDETILKYSKITKEQLEELKEELLITE